MERLIQQRAGSGKSKLLEKGMKTPSSLVIDLLTSISNCYYCREIHKEGCQTSPWQQKLLVLSHVPPNLDPSIWSISTNLSYFFCLLWATGLVGTGIFCIIYSILIMARNTYMYILYYLLYAGIGFWSLNKLSKMNKSLINSSYQHLPGVDPENSEKGGWDTCPLAGYIETFYYSDSSIKIIQNNFKEKRPPLAHP